MIALRRRTLLTTALAALAAGVLPRTAQARAADALIAAYRAAVDPGADLPRIAAALPDIGWRRVTGRGRLEQAAAVLGDSRSVLPATTPTDPQQLTAQTRARARAAIGNNVLRVDILPYHAETWQAVGTGTATFLHMHQARRGTPFWFAAATADAAAGRAMLLGIDPDAPEIPAGALFHHASFHARRTPLVGPADRITVRLTAFDRPALDAEFSPAFEAAAGFLIQTAPGR